MESKIVVLGFLETLTHDEVAEGSFDLAYLNKAPAKGG
jgi:hypothetical protein